MPDESVHYELPVGPDATYPDRLFKDGAGAACVRAMPVWATTWGSRSPAFALEDAVAMIALGWMRRRLWRWVRRDEDDRRKLVVSSTRRRFPVWWRTVGSTRPLSECAAALPHHFRGPMNPRGATAGYARTSPEWRCP